VAHSEQLVRPGRAFEPFVGEVRGLRLATRHGHGVEGGAGVDGARLGLPREGVRLGHREQDVGVIGHERVGLAEGLSGLRVLADLLQEKPVSQVRPGVIGLQLGCRPGVGRGGLRITERVVGLRERLADLGVTRVDLRRGIQAHDGLVGLREPQGRDPVDLQQLRPLGVAREAGGRFLRGFGPLLGREGRARRL